MDKKLGIIARMTFYSIYFYFMVFGQEFISRRENIMMFGEDLSSVYSEVWFIRNGLLIYSLLGLAEAIYYKVS